LTSRRANELIGAIEKICSQDTIPEFGNLTYLNWISSRRNFWSSQTVKELDTKLLLADINAMSTNKRTKIVGMGLPLTANFFADTGIVAFAKPDLHVTPVINLLTLRYSDEDAFTGIVEIAKEEDLKLQNHNKFSWLKEHGGLWPRYLDRLIYLIGSDNFKLDGTRNKNKAPRRRDMIRQAILDEGIVRSKYQFQI